MHYNRDVNIFNLIKLEASNEIVKQKKIIKPGNLKQIFEMSNVCIDFCTLKENLSMNLVIPCIVLEQP